MQFAVIDYNGLTALTAFYGRAAQASCWTTAALRKTTPCGIADFVDGTSQTIDVVETVNFGRGVWIHGRPHYNQAAYAINSLNGRNDAPTNPVYPDGFYPPMTNLGPGKAAEAHGGFRAATPAERTLSSSMVWTFLEQLPSVETLTALSTRDGCEVVDGSSY